MTHSLFISDLHLCSAEPQISEAFRRFLRDVAPAAEALYILGDLFEYWAGDDDLEDPLHQEVANLLDGLAAQGVRIYLMHGNRDLLIGQRFVEACGGTLLPDPTVVELYGVRTLLSHGDALCTDDVAYQAFRTQVRDPRWQAGFLAQPLAQRRALIQQVRAKSNEEKQIKSAEIMDANVDAVAALLRDHGYPRLIHGHTHRPAHHRLHLDGHDCERWVLSDWSAQGHALRCDQDGCQPITF